MTRENISSGCQPGINVRRMAGNKCSKHYTTLYLVNVNKYLNTGFTVLQISLINFHKSQHNLYKFISSRNNVLIALQNIKARAAVTGPQRTSVRHRGRV